MEIITWNHSVISIRHEYLKPYDYMQIICIRYEYLISYNSGQKKKEKREKQLHKKRKYKRTLSAISKLQGMN